MMLPCLKDLVSATDIVIIGAGYVGSTLALALARNNIRCTLIEQSKSHITSFDNRHFGLTKDSREIFEKLKLWERLESNIVSIKSIKVRCIDINSQQKNKIIKYNDLVTLKKVNNYKTSLDALGYILPAQKLQLCLRDAVRNEALINDYYDIKINSLHRTSTGWRIDTENNVQLNTLLIVAADGAQSLTRMMLGIGTKRKSYAQIAWQWYIHHSKAHCECVFEYLLSTGPYVVIPSQDINISKLIWCYDHIEQIKIKQMINQHFPPELGIINNATLIGHYPLQQIQAINSYTNAAVLIGNAYLNIHPVGAQGLNLGLRDAWELSKHIITEVKSGIAPGKIERLAIYHRRRCADRWLVKQVADFFGQYAGKLSMSPKLLCQLVTQFFKNTLSQRLIIKIFHG